MKSSSLYRFCSLVRRGDPLWERRLTLAFVALVPLKLTPAYIALIPALILRLGAGRLFPLDSHEKKAFLPLLFFFIAASLASLFGLAPVKSLLGILGFIGASLVIPLVAKEDPKQICTALFLGSFVAGLDSFRTQLFPSTPRLFLGEVTESGQLALVAVVVVGAGLSLASKLRKEGASIVHLLSPLALGGVILSALIALGFTRALPPFLSFGLVVAATFAIAFSATWKRSTDGAYLFCCSLLLPLVTSNLIFNLKRGPFVGVFVASALLFFLHARRILLPFVAISIFSIILLEPLRIRFAHSMDHFFISGGRSVMWRIGGELISRYPLGLGFKNSGYLRSFSSEIPPELRHFHNNALNIVVESGWISACLFFAWVLQLLKHAFTLQLSKAHCTPLLRAAGCALVSWQVAGLVEYNVGDKEVMLLVFTVVGLIAGFGKLEKPPAEREAKGG